MFLSSVGVLYAKKVCSKLRQVVSTCFFGCLRMFRLFGMFQVVFGCSNCVTFFSVVSVFEKLSQVVVRIVLAVSRCFLNYVLFDRIGGLIGFNVFVCCVSCFWMFQLVFLLF